MTKATRKALTLENAGFLSKLRIGQTMSWACQNNVSIKRLSFAFFACSADGITTVKEGRDAYRWLNEDVTML